MRCGSRLLPFAQAVNKALDACGFPLCRGDIMAGNPQWCLSLDEWKAKFTDWIVSPTPDALLNATIFFDFRPLYGEETLAERLREWLMRVAPTNAMFLVHAAGNALTCRPPLGKIRDFVLDDSDKDFPHTINLKMYGSRPFVDAARVFSLIYGVQHTNTAERLRMVGGEIGLVGDDLGGSAERVLLHPHAAAAAADQPRHAARGRQPRRSLLVERDGSPDAEGSVQAGAQTSGEARAALRVVSERAPAGLLSSRRSERSRRGTDDQHTRINVPQDDGVRADSGAVSDSHGAQEHSPGTDNYVRADLWVPVVAIP